MSKCDLIARLQRLGDCEHSDLEVAHEALAEIVRLRIALADRNARIEVLRADAERFIQLQNMPPVEAQAFFWRFTSRKQRAKAIDAAIKEQSK